MLIYKDNYKLVKELLDVKNSQYDPLQILFDSIIDHLYIKDKKNSFVIVNKAQANFYNKKPCDFIGKTDFDLFPKEKAKEYFDHSNKVIKSGKPMLNKTEKFMESGSEIWLSKNIFPLYNTEGEISGIIGISRNFTERKKVEDALIARDRNFFSALMDNIPDSIYFKDKDCRFILINQALAEKFGLKSPSEAIGKIDYDFFEDEHAKQAHRDEQLIIKTGESIINLEEKETYENKTDRWVSSSKMPWYDKDGNIIGIFGITRDITDKKIAEDKIKYLSFHDTLTGLYNRAYFEEELKRLDTSRQLPLTLVMGDVNNLKLINDAYGHKKGDELLVKIALVLKDVFREEDILSRWGGDEFIAILPKTTFEQAENIIKRAKDLCKQRSTKDMLLSISLGISTKHKPKEVLDDILKKAEYRMYKTKAIESKSNHESLIETLRENIRKGDSRSRIHIKKMENYALILGKNLNLSNTKIEELKLLISLHNIGKITFIDEIMSKKGRLTKDEWEIIKELPVIGYQIAESSTKLKSIAEPILAHHEWFDGSGYPRGIKGEDIPILSRISSLINAYEAMISPRPYRNKAMTTKQAIKEIKRCRGTQFDPDIANIFIQILEKE
jgi:diguanylate cyclase (GGDEF)-like protein/PAS domain S-box-containing protein